MKNKQIYITQADFDRLKEVIELAPHAPDVLELEAELKRAVIVDVADIPADVITMNSRLCLRDIDTGRDEICQVVYPDEADIKRNKISVLAPIGTAVLGYKSGDLIEWKVPAGLRRLKIKKVLYQPEAEKDYHL